MTLERIEYLTGDVDGVNVTFTAPTPYTAGSTRLFVRGLLRRSGDEDGWTETDPAAGIVTLAEPLEVGDGAPALYYLDPTSGDSDVAASGYTINGVLSVPALSGAVAAPALSGAVASVSLTGVLAAPSLVGVLVTPTVNGALSCPS